METHHSTTRQTWPWALLMAACLLAFILRLYRLPDPALRWDEGWTLAHGHLPWRELIRIAALEWHPPLFYLLFKIWRSFAGQNTYTLRFLAVWAGVLTVPLAYAAARAWAKSRPMALLAAFYAAAAPLLIYYGQVNRMYAWTPVGTLLAAWVLLKATSMSQRRWRWAVASGFATALALYLLYYTAWPLMALYAYALATRRDRWRTTVASALVAAALFAPWLAYAAGAVQGRFYPAGTLSESLSRTWELVAPSIQGLVFAFGSGQAPVWLTAGLLLLGLLLTPPRCWRPMLLPALVIGITVAGVTYGAQAVRFFAVRHFVPAAPFLGFALAWALDRLFARWKPLLPVAMVALAAAFWPTSSQFVYAKTLEVVDPFDPQADWNYLAPHLLPGDKVFFNNLAKAGWYEQARAGQGAPWSFALRWDPIVEPMESVVIPRIESAMVQHERLWFVLYKGATGPNAELRAWLAANKRLYPAREGWTSDTLFLGYVSPRQPPVEVPVEAIWRDPPLRLAEARLTETACPGGGIAVELAWQVEGPVDVDAKVFIHAVAADGHLVAQHDARPGDANRPTQTLAPGEAISDRHGIALPPDTQGQLTIRVGLYDAATGERFALANGADTITLDTVTVSAP